MIGPFPAVPKTLGQDIRELCEKALKKEEPRYCSEFEEGVLTGRKYLAEDIRDIFKSHGLWRFDKV